MDDDDGGAAGGGEAWDRRGDRSSREKAHRRARAELKRFAASRKFPTNVGVVQVHSLGKVKPEPGFYALGRLAPVGFRASRTERSPADESLVHCVMEVVEVPDPEEKGAADGDSADAPDAKGDGGAGAAVSGGAPDNGAGDDAGRPRPEAGGEARDGGGTAKTVAVFRVTLSGLKGKR
ncbi:unnamed protein product, partial [Ectocarpus sp. 12 AP-2014]